MHTFKFFIYQEILIFFLSDEQLQRKWTFYVWFINTCKKNTPPPLLKYFMEMGGGGFKRIIHTPHQNILEGNGVVFGNLTFNNLRL